MMRPRGENALAVRDAKSARAHKTHSLEAKEREVTFLRREVERVTAERDALQLSSNGDKAYIRRLEHKMTSSGETSAAERCAQLRARVAKLKEELERSKKDAEEHKKQLDASTRDKASLAHALELRAKDLSSEAGEDVPSRLLYAVAKGREESVSLAVQLSEKSDALEQAMRSLEQMRERVESAEQGKRDAVEDAAAAAANAADADARAAAARADAERVVEQAHAESARAAALADEALADAEAVGAELRRERERGEALRRAVDEAEAATTRDLERMREEMTLATEATEREARESAEDASRARDAAESKVVFLEQELVLLKRRLEEESSQRKANDSAQRETLLDAQKHLATTRAHAAALEEECGNLTAQIEAFAVVNARLQEAASSAQARADAQSAKTSSLQAQIMQLESSSRVGRESRVAGETELKARLKKALEELASVIAERDETRLALRETLAKCASAMAKSERAETAERAARAAVASLEKGKRLLQETMAGQLEAVKAQLTRQREQNGALEAAVRRRDADADRLRKMVAKEGIGGGHEAKQGGT
jgi:chromosome segregation ATPase